LAYLAIIPARGGSKEVPRKNLRLLGGMPLVAHSIVAARESDLFGEVYVSTEDGEVGKVAADFGAVIIERPPDLATDEAPMPPVVEHAVAWYERQHGPPDAIFLLHPTSPFRSPDDIREAASLLNGDCDSVMAVFEPADPPQWGLRSTAAGYLEPTFPVSQYLSRRQDLEPTYFDGPLYAIETGAFLKQRRFLTARTRFFVIPQSRALDIDTELDFQFAEFLLARSATTR
jgi:N-acylneuraminate cytidylyltransferase/CMP-N,N'-diacetyllegionaminic acid synthase